MSRIDACVSSPFFILSRERSGSTLLRHLLNQHPEIFIPPESPFLTHLYSRYSQVTNWDKRVKSQILEDILMEPYFQQWGFSKEELAKVLDSKLINDFASFSKRIMSLMAPESTKQLGDKNPSFVNHWKWLNQVFPESRYVILIRDPRAQVNSMMRVRLEKKWVASMIIRWSHIYSKLDQYWRIGKNKFIWVKYENLILSPREEIGKICDFLEIEKPSADFQFSFEYPRSDMSQNPDHHNSSSPFLDTSKIDDWEKQLGKSELELINWLGRKSKGPISYPLGERTPSILSKVLAIPKILYGYLYFIYLWGFPRIPFRLRMVLFNFVIKRTFGFWKDSSENLR